MRGTGNEGGRGQARWRKEWAVLDVKILIVGIVNLLLPGLVLPGGQNAPRDQEEDSEEEEKRGSEEEEEGTKAPHLEDDATQQRPHQETKRRGPFQKANVSADVGGVPHEQA